MLDIHFRLIAMAVRHGRTELEREAANQLRWWCIGEWLQGRIEIPPRMLGILLEA